MSFYTGTQPEVLFSGPPASYTAGGGSSTSAFNLTAGSTGNYHRSTMRDGGRPAGAAAGSSWGAISTV